MENKKILILRFSSIGDIVLTTPVVRNIKLQLKGAEIHYGTKTKYASILEANPYIDQLQLFDGENISAYVGQLKAEKYDYVIDLHKSLRTLYIKNRLSAQSYTFNKLNKEKWLYVNLKINTLPNIHIVDRYMEAVKPLGIVMDPMGLDYFIPEKDEVERDWLPEAYRQRFAVFAIGGQHATKRLPLPRMIELCDRINKPVILLGGPEDAATGEQIVRFFERGEISEQYEEGLTDLNKKAVVFNGCGKFNLNQSASLIKQSIAVFTHDTGLMHIAAAFHKKVFSIWGSTSPHFGMYPYRTQFTIFENNNIDCRPCSKIGYNKCPKGHFKCMNDVIFDFYLP